MYGVVDTGADITIIGGRLFKLVATKARFKKRNFHKPDTVPHNYDGKVFTLDGKMDLKISFQGKDTTTPVYITMDAKDQLLLSEVVCRQLGIVQYHPNVEVWRGGHKSQSMNHQSSAVVPMVRVKLVLVTRCLPQQTALARVQVENVLSDKPVLLETSKSFRAETGLELDSAVIVPDEDGYAYVTITNNGGYTVKLDADTEVGHVEEFEPHKDGKWKKSAVQVMAVSVPERVEKLMELLSHGIVGSGTDDQQKVRNLLLEHHEAFALSETEQGRTDLVQFKIDTGDAIPKKQPVHRVPFAVHNEVQHQLKLMEEMGVVQPSISPWASAIVLVRKKDGTLRFCVDYRSLNSVTKKDTFPLPRIADLLDQLEQSCYFSTLDLASGYWQIKVHPDSQEKTAFITHSGLYEF